MEFKKERVYTAINADELKPGDKVIVANDLKNLKRKVLERFNYYIMTITSILGEEYLNRVSIDNDRFPFAYLVERKENCTNCGNRGNSYCSCFTRDKSDDELSRTVCGNYIRLSEQKAEHKCGNCKYKDRTDGYCPPSCQSNKDVCNKWETEKHYRPFRDTNELVKVWCDKGGKWQKRELTMPYIWVKKHDDTDRGKLIISFSNNGCSVIDVDEIEVLLWEDLFNIYTFLDGSPCGVKE